MYLFLNRYCRITARLAQTGLTTLTGWITQADAFGILLIDEDNNEHYVKKEDLVGDVVVVLEQREREERKLEMKVA